MPSTRVFVLEINHRTNSQRVCTPVGEIVHTQYCFHPCAKKKWLNWVPSATLMEQTFEPRCIPTSFCYPTTWKKEKGSSRPWVIGNMEGIWNGKSMKDDSLNCVNKGNSNNAHSRVWFMPSPVLRSHSPFPPCLHKIYQSPEYWIKSHSLHDNIPNTKCIPHTSLLVSAFPSQEWGVDYKRAGSQVCAHLCFFLIVLCGSVLSSWQQNTFLEEKTICLLFILSPNDG